MNVNLVANQTVNDLKMFLINKNDVSNINFWKICMMPFIIHENSYSYYINK